MATELEFRDSAATATFSARRGLGDLLFRDGIDVTVPVISDVTPAEGAELEATDTVAFKVTDSGGNLSRTTVLAYYPTLARFEVVWFGATFAAGAYTFTGGFGPQYSGTRTEIDGGFQFSDVIRRGDWPAFPTLVVDAGDSDGNESA